jgi:putative protease
MEILAPAGSAEGLAASIMGGCDAVYLGGKRYGARAFADNFTDQQIEGAVNYAHNRGTKVYVTVNTLIKDTEMDDAISFVKFLEDIGADAVIIQDLGLLRRTARYDIPKHASTQLGIHSRAGLEWCAANGVERAILARELTLEEIKKITVDSPVETEVFVQGAMCYCVSGGCLFSSMVGGRSGNRGQCAQPCRKKYRFGNKNGYVMSCADIHGLDLIPELKKMGISAAKIEGRMRSPAYAYLASKVYSMKEKGYDNKEIAPFSGLLHTVFNRGICDGYYRGIVSPVQPYYPDNRGYYLGKAKISNRSFSTGDLNETVGVKDGISIFRGDEKIGGFKISELKPVTVPFKIQDGEYDIYRTYDPRIDEIKNAIGEPPALTGVMKRQIPKKGIPLPRTGRTSKKSELSFYVSSIKNLEAVIGYADRIYFENRDAAEEAEEICNTAGAEFVTLLPRFDSSDRVSGSKSVMVNSVGQYYANRNAERVYGSPFLNMFNSHFPSVLYQTVLSMELSRSEIKTIAECYGGRLEVMVFGRQELMITRDPDMGNGILIDEKDYEFPVYKDGTGFSRILNSADLMMLEHLEELQKMGIDSFGIDLRKRPVKLAETVAEAFSKKDLSKKQKITEMCGSVTYGHYLRGVS